MDKRDFMRVIATGAIVAPLTALAVRGKEDITAPVIEDTYERVMRTRVLRCGIMLWPPYFESDPNTGAITGLGAELYREMAQLMDIKIEYVEIAVGQQVEELKRGRIDAVCNDGPYVFSAMKFVDYSHPAYYSPVFAYVREDEKRFAKPEDLNDTAYTFIGMDGDLSLDLAQRNYPKAKRVSLPGTADAASLMLDVTTGKADAVIIDPYAVNSFNRYNRKALKSLGDPVAVYPVGISVAKGQQNLLNMMNAGVDAVWNTYIAPQILKKYDPSETAFYSVAQPFEARMAVQR